MLKYEVAAVWNDEDFGINFDVGRKRFLTKRSAFRYWRSMEGLRRGNSKFDDWHWTVVNLDNMEEITPSM